jgi:hypothetical protein
VTIICAAKGPSGVWIGSDSRATASGFVYPGARQKWRCVSGWWIGACGRERIDWLIERAARQDREVLASMTAGDVGDWLISLVVADKWVPEDEKSAPSVYDFNAILVSPSLQLFEVGSSGTASEAGEDFIAMGSGYEYALGANSALRGALPVTRVEAAIEAACRYRTDCGGPPFIKHLRAAQDQIAAA